MSKNGGNMKRKSLAIITILLLLFQMIAIFLFQNVVSADSNRYDYCIKNKVFVEKENLKRIKFIKNV